MKSLGKLFAAAILAGAMSSASATILSFGINLNGAVSVNTGNITALTNTKNIPTADTVSVCVGDPGACTLANIIAGGAATFSTGTLNTHLGADVFTVSAGNLVFSFTTNVLTTIVPTTATTTGSIVLQFNGTITSGPAGFLGQTASLAESCNQVTLNGAITCSETVATPGIPITVPEPMSLALLGIGLAGLGFATRRRKS